MGYAFRGEGSEFEVGASLTLKSRDYEIREDSTLTWTMEAGEELVVESTESQAGYYYFDNIFPEPFAWYNCDRIIFNSLSTYYKR